MSVKSAKPRRQRRQGRGGEQRKTRNDLAADERRLTPIRTKLNYEGHEGHKENLTNTFTGHWSPIAESAPLEDPVT
jgi:hypothetical protein